MKVIENIVQTKDYLVKSNLPDSDFVINPYTGCPHGCMYCYARFMKRFTNHSEEWGTFIDVKKCSKEINTSRLKNKSVFLSSVTDCYNPFEAKYKVTQNILEQLKDAKCSVSIATKSGLIVRDINLLKQFKDLKAAISVNTLDAEFQQDMDHADSVSKRLLALKELYSQGIYTILFLSPIFPFITDFKKILEETSEYVCEYWFENLNLRGEYKKTILAYISKKYPQYLDDYRKIYVDKNLKYWEVLSDEITDYCRSRKIKYKNYFYHDRLRQN